MAPVWPLFPRTGRVPQGLGDASQGTLHGTTPASCVSGGQVGGLPDWGSADRGGAGAAPPPALPAATWLSLSDGLDYERLIAVCLQTGEPTARNDELSFLKKLCRAVQTLLLPPNWRRCSRETSLLFTLFFHENKMKKC